MKKLIIGIMLILLLGGLAACSSDDDPAMMFLASSDSDDALFGMMEMGLDRTGVEVAAERVGGLFVDVSSGSGSDDGPPPGFGDSEWDTELGAGDGVSGSSQSGGSKTAPAPAPAAEIQRMIVRTGNLALVVDDVEATLESITSLAGTYDGYVVDSRSWQDGERMVGNISIRVDAAWYDTAMSAIKNMAVEVKSQTSSGKDVTEEYVDLNSKLTNLEASESQLLVLMEKAGTIEEILEVQRELTKTRESIEEIRGRMQYLEQTSSTSLIEVSLEHSQLSVVFVAYQRVVKEGEDAWFRPEVSGGFEPYTYKWDFGDGDTSTEERPHHSYSSDETFTVILVVSDDRGNSAVAERVDYMTVLPGWSFTSVVESVWNGVVVFAKVLLNILIGILIASPIWIILLIILYFTWWRPRRRRKAQQNKGPEKSAQ